MEEENFPISVSMRGILRKEKRKMFITSVLWSDQNNIVVYRSLEDFRALHKELKAAFPSGNKIKKSDNMLPKFKAGKINKKRSKKGPTKSLVNLKYLQRYCNELLSCQPRVSQSAQLVLFFKPKPEDLDPDFSKKAITIMLPEDEIKSSGGLGDGGSVTQPFVSETYKCIAAYETKDTKNKPFKVAADERVDVLIKDKGGWWLVENEEKRMAWFPAPYLEKLDGDDEDDVDETPERGRFYTAVKSYNSTKDDEISVNLGATVEVTQRSDNGWWLIRYKGREGYIPAMYLKPQTNHHSPHHHHSSNSFLLQQQSHLSRSHGNLPTSPPVRSSSPFPSQVENIQRSRSMNRLSEEPQPPVRHSPAPVMEKTTATSPAVQALPVIMVEDENEEQSPTADGVETSGSDSEDLSSSSVGSSLGDERLRLGHVSPPPDSSCLSPTSPIGGKLFPSVSDPNIFKSPVLPKVPPRPQTQEILTRCSTVTRKNVAKNSQQKLR